MVLVRNEEVDHRRPPRVSQVVEETVSRLTQLPREHLLVQVVDVSVPHAMENLEVWLLIPHERVERNTVADAMCALLPGAHYWSGDVRADGAGAATHQEHVVPVPQILERCSQGQCSQLWCMT